MSKSRQLAAIMFADIVGNTLVMDKKRCDNVIFWFNGLPTE